MNTIRTLFSRRMKGSPGANRNATESTQYLLCSLHSIYCVFSNFIQYSNNWKISHNIPQFLILSGARVIIHAQVHGMMERRTDKHNVFDRPSAGFLLHTTFHAQFAVKGKEIVSLSGLVLPDHEDTRNLQNVLNYLHVCTVHQ